MLKISSHLLNSLFSPAHPPFPVSDDLEPPGEQIGDDRPAGLHRLLLHHPQGEAQRDHAAHHRPEPRRLLQLDNAQKEAQERKHMSSRSKYCKWRNACVQSWYCQRVSLGLQHWRAHIFVQLCKCICAVVQMYLCNCTNEFVQSYKCICAIVQMYLCNGTNVFVQLYFFNCAELFVQPSDHCLSTCACSP